jgi:hypothetical protein
MHFERTGDMHEPDTTDRGQITVRLKYRFPGDLIATTYTRDLTEAAIGAVMMVMDCLAEQTDDEDVRRIGNALAAVVRGGTPEGPAR